MLGVKRFLRVGTCGGLQPDLELGDLIVALTAVPADGTARHYVERRAPLPDRGLGARPRRRPRGEGARAADARRRDRLVGHFYDPDEDRHERWSSRGVLAVEMEAAVIFTLGALRKVQAGCLLTVSDIVDRRRVHADLRRGPPGGRRPHDPRRAHHGHLRAISETVFLVNPAADNGATGKRWPEIARSRGRARARGRHVPLRGAGQLAELAREAAAKGAKLLVAVGGDGTVNEVVNGIAGVEGVELAIVHRGTGGDFVRTFGIPHKLEAHSRSPAGRDARDRPRPGDLPRLGGSEATAGSRTRERRHERRRRQARRTRRARPSAARSRTRGALSRSSPAGGTREIAVTVDDEKRTGRDVRRDRRERALPRRRMRITPEAEPDDGALRRPDRRRRRRGPAS